MVLVVGLLALFVRVIFALISPHVDPFISENPLHGDAASYDRIARSLLAGTGFSQFPPEPDVFWPPLYPISLWLTYSIFGYELIIARLVQAVLGAATCVMIYLLGEQLFERRIALLAGLGAVFYPYHILFGNWLIAESLFMLLLVVAVYLLAQLARKPSIPLCLASGVVIGLGILAKPTLL
ncbi:MAG: ArnT family glycosyltransferase, partial [Chloroflexota bacterium]